MLSPNKFITGNNRNLATVNKRLTTIVTTPFTTISSRKNVTFNASDSNDNEIREKAFKQVDEIDDKFFDEYQRNRIPISNVQRFILSAGSSIAALLNPQRYAT